MSSEPLKAMFQKILFPIHQSREAHSAIKVVVEMVQKYESHVILLAVTDTTVIDAAVVGEAATKEDVSLLLSEVQEILVQHGVETEVIVREGNPAFTICDVADEINADLIAMGSRGIGIDEERATESVASRVINLSPCPVLIVP
jgi:nucleotide-binding universal stress UspA family protein